MLVNTSPGIFMCLIGNHAVLCTNVAVSATCALKANPSQRSENTKYPARQKARGHQDW